MGTEPGERGNMGVTVTPLTKREQLLYCMSTGFSAIIGMFMWRAVFSMLSPHVMYPLLIGSIVGLTIFLICVLMWLRLMFAHLFWLKLWTLAAPLVISSMIVLPIHPMIAIALV